MNIETAREHFQDLGCLPHQVDFAAGFVAPNSAKKHLLTSLPGLGKSFIGSAIVGYAATHLETERILILAPTVLAYQWADMVRRHNPNLSCEIVDRRRLRELESHEENTASPWDNSHVVVMSIDLAKQPEIAEALFHTTWDCLVVDESHHLAPRTQRYQVVEGLVNRNSEMRVLYMHPLFPSAQEKDAENPLFADVSTTVWSRQTVKNKDGQPLLPEVQIEWIRHKRQADEQSLLVALQEALQVIVGQGQQGQFTGTLLLKAASSSLFALEQRLNRMRQRRNEMAHGLGDFLQESADDTSLWSDADAPDAPTAMSQSPELMKFTDHISGILEKLEEVETDSKLDALLSLLQTLGVFSSDDRRVCIFTSYVDTATYLESALNEQHSRVFALTGNSSFAEREQIVTKFSDEGGIMVATSAMSTRISEVTAIIFYDLPMNPAILDARIGQFVRIGRSGAVHVYAFTDESDSLSIERLQRKAIGMKDSLGSAELGTQIFPNHDEQGP